MRFWMQQQLSYINVSPAKLQSDQRAHQLGQVYACMKAHLIPGHPAPSVCYVPWPLTQILKTLKVQCVEFNVILQWGCNKCHLTLPYVECLKQDEYKSLAMEPVFDMSILGYCRNVVVQYVELHGRWHFTDNFLCLNPTVSCFKLSCSKVLHIASLWDTEMHDKVVSVFHDLGWEHWVCWAYMLGKLYGVGQNYYFVKFNGTIFIMAIRNQSWLH